MSLFEFQLASLESIEPWGNAPDLTLHWFGLSDGTYHINLGSTRLLEYAAGEGLPRFVEYNLARIHEDILELLPAVLEPIPASVIRHFVNGELGSTIRQLQKSWEALPEGQNSLDVALLALGQRCLDTGYLSLNSWIWIWTYDTKTIIEWDNRQCLIDGKLAWTAAFGRHELATNQFVEEVKSFHMRLMAAMGERVRKVSSNWTRPAVSIDFEQLAAEQVERSTSFDKVIECGPQVTDWQEVELALSRSGIGDCA